MAGDRGSDDVPRWAGQARNQSFLHGALQPGARLRRLNAAALRQFALGLRRIQRLLQIWLDNRK